jgi:hypothetical protein
MKMQLEQPHISSIWVHEILHRHILTQDFMGVEHSKTDRLYALALAQGISPNNAIVLNLA